MDLVSYALVTLDNTKTFLGISTHEKDELLKMLINMSTDFIETKCGRRFASTVYTDSKYNGTGNNELVLTQFPVISFTSLYRNTSCDNSDNWELIDSSDYWIDLSSGVISKTSIFSKGVQNYKVTYTGGYATIPYDLQYSCMTFVSDFLTKGKSSGIKSESLGDHSITFEDIYQTNNTIKDILNNYMNVSL